MASEEDSTHCQRPPSPELVVECCSGDLCNANASLQLPAKGLVLVFLVLYFVKIKNDADA